MLEGTQKKFRDLRPDERIDSIVDSAGLSKQSEHILRDWQNAIAPQGENFFAFARMAIGMVPDVRVNGRTLNAPLITEEPSVIAAAARGAKTAEKHGGFRVTVSGTNTIGQVQIVGIPDSKIDEAITTIKDNEKMLIALANSKTPHLVEEGGGAITLKPKRIATLTGPQLIVDFMADCKDAMGANSVSKMAEAMGPEIARLTGGHVLGRIISNLSGRHVVCEVVFDKDMLALDKEIDGKIVKISGDEMIDRIVHLGAWAEADQYRATTHNKGIMNGIIGVALAVGQDTRAIEAAAHSFAAFNRPYGPLSHFEKDADGNLYGCLEMLLPVGVIGGTIRTNEMTKACLEVTQCTNPDDLAALIVAVGFATNVSALRMLAGEGITNGHLPLHMKRTE